MNDECRSFAGWVSVAVGKDWTLTLTSSDAVAVEHADDAVEY